MACPVTRDPAASPDAAARADAAAGAGRPGEATTQPRQSALRPLAQLSVVG